MNENEKKSEENETHTEAKNGIVHVEQRTHSYHYSTDPDDHYFGGW